MLEKMTPKINHISILWWWKIFDILSDELCPYTSDECMSNNISFFNASKRITSKH